MCKSQFAKVYFKSPRVFDRGVSHGDVIKVRGGGVEIVKMGKY